MSAPLHSPSRFRTQSPLLWFAVVFAVVFAIQTWQWWRQGEMLAGMHADGPFHFASELARSSVETFPTDPAVQASRDVGSYEYFYASVIGLAKMTGLPLLTTNLVLCWTANLFYLGGVFVMLRKLHVAPWACAFGTWLAAQPFVLIGMASGVTHSLAIPREVWLWPLPWFVACFFAGRHEGRGLVVFFAALGAIYCLTYPLWAALLGVAFGLADAWRFARGKRWAQFGWLALGAVVCVLIVAVPALSTMRAVGGGASAVLDYNEITRSVFLTKGFRRLLLFATVGLFALWWLRKNDEASSVAWRRLQQLLLASLLVCAVYEPLQRLAPSLSMLYLGRLSLVVFLVSVIAVAGWIHARFPVLPCWGKALVIAAALCISLDPARTARKDFATGLPPTQVEFVQFCRWVKENTPVATLAVAEPTLGSHYFRVYAERGLWINPKDTGVLSRTHESYALATKRVAKLNALYAPATPADQREALLTQLRADGVSHVVTRTNHAWAEALTWPVIHAEGAWQLRAPLQTTNRF